MNKRLEEVGYRPLQLNPVLQKGILPIERDDGSLERRVAAGLARVADAAFDRAEQTAQIEGERAGMRDAMLGGPQASDIEGGYQKPSGIRVVVPPANIRAAIEKAATRNGVSSDYLTQIAQVESGFDPNAKNPSSTAGGLFGFIDGTARQYNLANKYDVDQSAEAAARLTSDNKRLLEGRLGRGVSEGELYLAHQQGAQGALDLLSNPDRLATEVVGVKQVLGNGGTEQMTARDFAAKWTSKFNTANVRRDQKTAASLPLVFADGSKPDIAGTKPELVSAFQDLQNAWGKQIPIRSAHRDTESNKRAGGADKSQHIDGNALDLDVRSMSREERKELIRTASAMGFTGIGVYENSIHLDLGNRRAWGPNYHSESVPDWARDTVNEHIDGKATSRRAADYGDDKADGPLRVTPTKTATFRPTGKNTVYGRAYDVAGTKTYLQMAKMAIIEDQAWVFDHYKDDPVKLKAAMGQLLEAHRRDGNILPEIEPEYVMSFQQNAFDLQRQAQSEFERKQRQQDVADYNERLSGLEDRKSQLMAGMDPVNPQTSDALQAIQGDIDNHYDSAVARGMMTPDQARQAKRSSRSDMTVGYYTKQAAGLKSDEIEQLSLKMTEDYAAGKLEGVTAEDWAKIDGGLKSALSARRAGDDKANADLASRGDDMAARILKGETVAPSELARLRTDAQTAPAGLDILASTEVRMRLSAALRTQPIGEVESRLEEILKRGDGSVKVDDVDYARGKIAELRKEMQADPIGVAEKFGLIPPAQPITIDGMTDPAKLRDALAFRRGSALAAAKHFGVPVRYFRPGEADQVVAAAMQNPDAMVAFTLNVTNAFGKDTPQAMREISDVGPVMAHAVGLSIATGDASLARDVAKISVMKANKELSVKLPEGAILSTRGNEYLAGALAAKPEMQNAVISTATLLFEKMAAEQGFDPALVKEPGSVAAGAWQKALDRALGGQSFRGVETGGLGTVNDRTIIVPAFMEKDRVESLFYGMTEKQLDKLAPRGSLNGIAVTASQMKDGYLVTVGDGLYRVATNDPDSDDPAYVIGKDGKPWVLDIRQLENMEKETSSPGPIGTFEGRLEEGNIDLTTRPQVKMPDGSIATVRSASFNIDGKEVLIPTVSADGRLLSDEEALALYKRTGQHLGKFDTPEHATIYAKKLHEAQERYYKGNVPNIGFTPFGAN